MILDIMTVIGWARDDDEQETQKPNERESTRIWRRVKNLPIGEKTAEFFKKHVAPRWSLRSHKFVAV